jgi:hypothetical protein
VIRYLVQHKLVDVVVTSAGAIEEDVMKTLRPHYMGSFELPGRELRMRGINRIGNLLVPNLNYVSFEDWFTPLLNKLQAAVARTMRSNLFSIPSDCPTREKRGWLGDAQVSVEEALRNLDAIAMYENWARVLGETITLGCTNPPSSTDIAVHPLAEVVGLGRPATYQCCGDVSSCA